MTKMKGSQIIMEGLLAEGVECIFGNPGSTEPGFYDGLQDYPQIKYYLGLHEGVAVAMADGYARASGKPGVVNVHIAVGLSHAMGMLFNAYRGGTPLVVTAGQQYSDMLAQEPILWANLVDMARPLTKWAVEVSRLEDIPVILRRAFKVATTPPTGPVFVSIPMDLQGGEADVIIGPSQRVYSRMAPDVEAVRHARQLLLEARSPAFIVGDGVAQSGAMAEAIRLAELVGARVFTIFNSEVVFPTNHPAYLGSLNLMDTALMRQQLGNTDVILGIGTPLIPLFLPASGAILSPETRIIHLDANAWEIGKNYPAAVGMWADPKAGLSALVEALEPSLTAEAQRQAAERRQAVGREKETIRERAEAMARIGWDDAPISDARLFKELRELLPADAIIADASVTAGFGLRSYLDFTEPGTYFGSRGGCLGWGIGGALGVKVALPHRPVVAMVGDGESMYYIQSLWTAAHHDIPVTIIVCNNKSYEIVKMNMVTWLRSIGMADRQSQFVGMTLDEPALDFAKIAQAFGVWGAKVERPQDLRAVLQEALSLGRPAVVDVALEGAMARTAKLMAAQTVS